MQAKGAADDITATSTTTSTTTNLIAAGVGASLGHLESEHKAIAGYRWGRVTYPPCWYLIVEAV
jgi:hypothetical protein